MLDSREHDCSLIMMILGYTFRHSHDGPLVGSSGFVDLCNRGVSAWVAAPRLDDRVVTHQEAF
jgi:hypothetical protein